MNFEYILHIIAPGLFLLASLYVYAFQRVEEREKGKKYSNFLWMYIMFMSIVYAFEYKDYGVVFTFIALFMWLLITYVTRKEK